MTTRPPVRGKSRALRMHEAQSVPQARFIQKHVELLNASKRSVHRVGAPRTRTGPRLRPVGLSIAAQRAKKSKQREASQWLRQRNLSRGLTARGYPYKNTALAQRRRAVLAASLEALDQPSLRGMIGSDGLFDGNARGNLPEGFDHYYGLCIPLVAVVKMPGSLLSELRELEADLYPYLKKHVKQKASRQSANKGWNCGLSVGQHPTIGIGDGVLSNN